MKHFVAWAAITLGTCLGSASAVLAQHDEHHHHHSGGWHSRISTGVAWPVYGSYALPAPYMGSIFSGTVLVSPLAIPAGAMYGPQLMQGVMGVDPNPGVQLLVNPQPLNVGAANPPAVNPPRAGGGGFGVLAGGAAPVAPPANVRASNEAARARAAQFLSFGDEHFHKQKYNDAYQRYKDAVGSAPDIADGYFREGIALAAMGQYELAAKAIKRGLQLNPDWPASDFHLDALYAGNLLAKTTHRENLAKAALERPKEADLLFLLAVQLFFDAQPERSRPFFQQAKALDQGEALHVRVFLDQLSKLEAAKAPRPAPQKL